MVYIYFIQAGSNGPVKIGLAVDPEERMSDLQVGNHEELRLLAFMDGSVELEREIHRTFGMCGIRGEWFSPLAPGLQDLITWARAQREAARKQAEKDLCVMCAGPVARPRKKFCAPACATERALERSRDSRRAATEAKL